MPLAVTNRYDHRMFTLRLLGSQEECCRVGDPRTGRDGRAQLERFKDAPLWMDGIRKTKEGEARCDSMNQKELYNLATPENPVLQMHAFHRKPQVDSEMNADDVDPAQFRGLQAVLELCVGARVLLTHNKWTAIIGSM